MTSFHLPVRPHLGQLQNRAKELLRDFQADGASARALFERYHPRDVTSSGARLADAQLVVARSHGVPTWARLKLACLMTDAIWRDSPDEVRALVLAHPNLLHEDARGVRGNWGPPMSYAANLGRDRIVSLLGELGAEDLDHAFDRACLQGRIHTARRLHEAGARPQRGAVMGPAETQSGDGMAYLLSLDLPIEDESGDPLAPVALVLETYCRNPAGKHRCLELFSEHGVVLPDTPPMAIHRGRIDLLERFGRDEPESLARTYAHEELFPPVLGCHADHTLALHGTPLAGTTLLHLCVDNDELEIAGWLLDRGVPVDTPARVDRDGFGGHTALFGCVVSQTYRVGLRRDARFARLLLDRGADPGARASLRKALRFVADETLHEYRDVTPVQWGERFHDASWVNRAAMDLISSRGG